MKEKCFAWIALVMLRMVCFGQTSNERADHYLTTQMKERKIPGLQLLVIRDKQVVFSVSKGFADVAFHIPVSDSTIFSINSVAKFFAGVGLLQLVEEGAVHLDDPVGSYLDSLPKSWQPITLRQLMGHVSGLPDIEDEKTGGLVGGNGEDSAWRLVQRLPLLAKPGETFYYNATNYLLIQKVLEKYSHMPYEIWVLHEQFLAAGMQRTFFANSNDIIDNKAPGYSYYYHDPVSDEFIKRDQLRELCEDFPRMMRTDAGAFTTSHELARWIIALQSGALLKKPENLRSLWTPVRLNNGKTEGFGGIFTGYALGWPVIDRKEHPAVAGIGGGRASVIVYPEDNITVILLTNLSGCAPEEIADKIAGYYFEH